MRSQIAGYLGGSGSWSPIDATQNTLSSTRGRNQAKGRLAGLTLARMEQLLAMHGTQLAVAEAIGCDLSAIAHFLKKHRAEGRTAPLTREARADAGKRGAKTHPDTPIPDVVPTSRKRVHAFW